MEINTNVLLDAFSQLVQNQRQLSSVADQSGNVMNSSLSGIQGVSEAGDIHGRFLQSDPASAQESLKKLSSHIGWMGSTFGANASVFGMQDMLMASGFDNAEFGYDFLRDQVLVDEEPDTSYEALSFSDPSVRLRGDIDSVVGDVLGINVGQIAESAARWSSLQQAALDAVGELRSIQSQVKSNNEGDAIDAGVAKLEQAIGSGTQFASNAGSMATKTGSMFSQMLAAQISAVAQGAAVKAIPEPEARLVAEKAAITKIEKMLQNAVTESLPGQGSLMEPMTASGGGTIDAGMRGEQSLGHAYDAGQVQWPQAMMNAAARGEIGPGSFEVVGGQLQPLQNIGMDAAQMEQFRAAAAQTLADVSEVAQLPGMDEAATRAASAPGATLATVSQPAAVTSAGFGTTALPAASTTPAGALTLSGGPLTQGGVLGGMGTGAPAAAAQGVGVGMGGTGLAGVQGGVPGLGAVPSNAAGLTGGAGAAGGGARGLGVAGSTNGLGGLAGSGGAHGVGGAGGAGGVVGRGAAALQRGSLGVGMPAGPLGAGSMGGAAGHGSGHGVNHAAEGHGGRGTGGRTIGLAGHGTSGAPGSGAPGVGTHGSLATGSAAHTTTTGWHAGRRGATSASGGRMGPMMGAHHRNDGNDKTRGTVKTVTTKIEADPNRKALLGELPPAVPGVIGAWVRS